jgi:hypothetical protein
VAEWIKHKLLYVLSDPENTGTAFAARQAVGGRLVEHSAVSDRMWEAHHGDVAEWSKAPHC